MPNQNLPIPDFADDGALLAVEAPTASRGTIRLLARADVIGVRVDLTAAGASALARMLVNAAAEGVAQLDQEGDDL
jgi:hypothetical protein